MSDNQVDTHGKFSANTGLNNPDEPNTGFGAGTEDDPDAQLYNEDVEHTAGIRKSHVGSGHFAGNAIPELASDATQTLDHSPEQERLQHQRDLVTKASEEDRG